MKKHNYRHVMSGLSGDYEIVEAKEPIDVQVIPQDVDNAVEFDPRNCAIAEACRRQGAVEAVIGASVAYVVIPDPSTPGKNIAVKYLVSPGTRKAIDRFDLTGIMPAKPFRLQRVKPSETAEGRAIRRARRPKVPTYQRDTRKGDRPVQKMELRNARDVIRLRNA